MPSYDFKVGEKYTRADVYRICDVPVEKQKGEWLTGYRVYDERYFIFCTVGGAGRTGDNHHNYFEGEDLIWHGKKKSHLNQPSIKNLLNPQNDVFVFYRTQDREPFTFAGLGKAKNSKDTVPVEVTWSFLDEDESNFYPEEISESDTYREGDVKQVWVNVYERNPRARQKCADHYGFTCRVCGFNFEKVYGALGKNFIHVHHLKPLGEIDEAYQLDPIKDLRPVCPNCHAMLHKRKPVLSIEELREILKSV